MRWALIAHSNQFRKGYLVQAPKNIPEDAVPAALAQEWIVLARDSQVYGDRVLYALMPPDVPLQSNPRRTDADTGEDA